jgi:cell division protein FtsZ
MKDPFQRYLPPQPAPTNSEPAPAGAAPRSALCIRVLGVGGAGGNAVSHLARHPLPGMEVAALSSNLSVLARLEVPTKVTLSAKRSRGLGAGGDPERGRVAAEEDADSIRALCAGSDIVFIVARMGGGTGTGASPVIARLAKEAGALVLGIVMLPFDCEGTRRVRQAQTGLQELKSAADGVICVPNQKVFKLVDEHTSLVEAFQITNELMAQAIRGIWGMLFHPGLIQVDFADLCSVTQGRHAESCLATAEAQGENRAREAVERLLAHPLLDSGALLAECERVLVSIAAGRSLTLSELNWIMERINRQCEPAQLTFGAAIDEELGERLVITLVSSRRPSAEPAPAADSSPAVQDDQRLGLPEAPDVPGPSRPASRFLPPPPTLTPTQVENLFSQQNGGRTRKGGSKMKQGQLPLEIVSKGRFEKSEPTIHQGQDLDVPTYIRRGVALN